MVFNRSVCLYLIALMWLCITSGCALQSRADLALAIATEADMQPVVFSTMFFELQGYQRFAKTGQDLIVYIEGDGASWKNRYTLASDPTPRNPTGLELAAQDHAPSILYLARPCQYKTTTSCTPKYWSSHRYSPEVTQALSTAIDIAKQESHSSKVVLIGYSGGGVLAALLATQRNDIKQFITIAANLDTSYWTQHHKVTPLWGSTNPCKYANILQTIPQIHIVGENDIIVPRAVIMSYLSQFQDTTKVTVLTIPKMSHHTDWANKWAEILMQIRPSAKKANSL